MLSVGYLPRQTPFRWVNATRNFVQCVSVNRLSANPHFLSNNSVTAGIHFPKLCVLLTGKRYVSSSGNVSINNDLKRLGIQYEDQLKREYPLVWLRDNCQCHSCFDEVSHSRIISPEDFQLNPKILNAALSGNNVEIVWEDGHKSTFSLNWLKERSFNKKEQQAWLDANFLPYKTWGAEFVKEIPQMNFEDVVTNDASLLRWLQNLETFGLCIISGVPNKLGCVRILADKVAYIRKTQYGEEFSVKAKPDASTLAYMQGTLPLHTDMPHHEYKPGINILHCYIQYAGVGGDSTVADGFHVAGLLRKLDPAAYQILAETDVSWQDIGHENGNRFHNIHNGPVICESRPCIIRRINYSQPLRDSHMCVPIDSVDNFYRAMNQFYQLAVHKDNLIQFKLQPGQIMAFNNLRILHGRSAFGIEAGGERHVQGAYIDWDEVRSRMRVLKAKLIKDGRI